MSIYYVNPSGGSDLNGGTDPSTDAWETLQHALDTVAAGSTIRLMNTAAHSPSATIDVDTTSGSSASPITIEGADSNGDKLTTGHTTINGTSLSGVAIIAVGEGYTDYIWTRIRFTASPTYGLENNAGGTSSRYWQFNNCRFDNCSNSGVFQESYYWQYNFCEFDNNGSYGYETDATRATGSIFNYCKFHDNTDSGAFIYIYNMCFHGCEFYNNGGHGLEFYRYCRDNAVIGCTFFRNTYDGLNVNDTNNGDGNVTIMHNVFRSNGDYGINIPAGYYLSPSLVDYNHFSDNTTNAVNWLGTGYSESNINSNGFGNNNTNGNPLFISEIEGEENFVPLTSSPVLGAGLNNLPIGAYGRPHITGVDGETYIVYEEGKLNYYVNGILVRSYS